MSPASQGNLEVERYIGSCLISSSVRVCNKGKKVSAADCNGVLNHRGGGSSAVYHSLPLCECGGLKFGGARYGSSGPVSGGWAGLPLISIAPTNSRRNRKPSVSSNVSANSGNRNSKQGLQSVAIVKSDVEQQSRSPLSRLAIHTQGAPLILSGRYKNNARGPQTRQFRGGDLSVRRSNSVRDAGSSSSSSTTPSSDCLSVASDESSGHSENSLPRIIKPRKRRKKDRKPPPPTASPPDPEEKSSETPSIVTLKPYVPLCYSGRWKDDTEVSCVAEVQGDDGQASEDDNPEPKLHHNFDDVEEDDVDTMLPYQCTTTVCQCRYCDPSGLIWDVDQHCYSPFLTPPSPTTDNSPYSKSPFANIPLFLTPPPTEMRSFDFLNKDSRSVPFSSEDHPAGLLRRSWSEPLPSDSMNGSFGAIGGRRNFEVEASGYGTIGRGKKCGDDIGCRQVSEVSVSQNLQVSTEIVTSPNGHRDIEIKFYSSSPPAGSSGEDKAEQRKKENVKGDDACEQSAKLLGEEVDQLSLHAEE